MEVDDVFLIKKKQFQILLNKQDSNSIRIGQEKLEC